VALTLEARTESIFHDDSYGYRPRRSALDAVARCRQRCQQRSWVIDLDVAQFFDSGGWLPPGYSRPRCWRPSPGIGRG
jgi:RNA-directed DNA polymerase